MTDFISRLPRNLYRAADVRQLDRIAIDELGIAGFKLMQTAGTVAFNALLEQWPQARFLQVYAGSGNNGGDGYILAGLAREFGLSVEVIQVGDSAKLHGDAKQAMDWAQQQQVTMLGLADFQQREEL
ncbi:MAG: NAD(P)H-hydrate epimerase, partial [Gammaproteobacteria bacterium]|nr:NAD(P)H-hydrate epimerase [Gammaproteobacteria bacterium]